MIEPIPVLTVWSPWASLIAVGAKPYEFRKNPPPKTYPGRRIAIHAAKRPIVIDEVEQLLRVLDSKNAWRTCLIPSIAIPLLERFLAEPKIVPYSSILCTVTLGAARDSFDIAREFGGHINDSDRDEHSNFGWPMLDIRAVVPPVEHKGQQGWSRWTPP